MTRALALERSLIAGTATKNAASQSLADEVANHLRSLLRDVICGHLDPDLAVIADELLEPDELLHSDDEGDADFEDAWPEQPDERAPAPAPVRAPLTAARAAAPKLVVPEPAGEGADLLDDAELDYAGPGYEAPAPAGDFTAARLASDEDLDTHDSDEAELLAATDVAVVPGARAAEHGPEHGGLEPDPPAEEGQRESPDPDERLPIDG